MCNTMCSTTGAVAIAIKNTCQVQVRHMQSQLCVCTHLQLAALESLCVAVKRLHSVQLDYLMAWQLSTARLDCWEAQKGKVGIGRAESDIHVHASWAAQVHGAWAALIYSSYCGVSNQTVMEAYAIDCSNQAECHSVCGSCSIAVAGGIAQDLSAAWLVTLTPPPPPTPPTANSDKAEQSKLRKELP